MSEWPLFLVALSLVLLVLAVILFLKKPSVGADYVPVGRLHEAEKERYNLQQNQEQLLKRITELQQENSRHQAQNIELFGQNTGLEEKYRQALQRLQEQKVEMESLQLRLTNDFKVLANEILEEKSRKFTVQNQVNIEQILSPLREKLKDFGEKVDRSYQHEQSERISLKKEIEQLNRLNQSLNDEARNLTRALKGDVKKQGNWGEMVLEKLLENSGLIKGENYVLQASGQPLRSEDGRRYIPDAIIHLPDKKHLVIDAKVSLVAYEQMVNAEDEEDREKFTRLHLASVKNHINELSAKNYQHLEGLQAPDFVLLFIPIESSFGVAIQADQDLFNFAWNRRVVIVSPSTLLATLRTVASLWKQELQNRNVQEIARLSGDLYDKFFGFISDMESIGKNLRQSEDHFNKAMGKLYQGKGNLIRTAEKIKKLGAKTTKAIDKKYIEDDSPEENELAEPESGAI